MTDVPNPSGTNTPETTGDDVLALMEPGEPYSTQDVQDALDISQSTAWRRLTDLEEAGEIEKKKLGHRTVVWMLPEGGDES
jgi:uncharacterized membrane protein